MYRCTECNSPLDELDVNFYKEFSDTSSAAKCKCCECSIGENLLDVIYRHDNFKRYSWLCWLTPAIFGFIMILSYMYFFWDFVELFMYLIFFWIFIWVWGAIKTIKEFDLDLEIYESSISHLETTYNESSGSYTTKSVNDSYISEDFWKALILGISYPIWSLFYLIYKNIKFAKVCPKEVRKAYAKANIVPFEISEKFKMRRWDKLEKYEKKISKIKETYSALGENVVEKKLNAIREPSFLLIVKGKIYRVVDQEGWLWYLRGIGKSKRNEKILNGCYFLYTDSNAKDLSKDWATLLDWKAIRREELLQKKRQERG